jgi:histidine triad (HIT) family protein
MPEQLTEEDIKNMSPEQIAELQKQNCIFCHIASGKIPAKKVYEDDKCFAILDINPGSRGHMLLIPKEHYVVMPQAPEDVVKHLGRVSKLLSKAALRALGAEGTNIFVANGAIAGQRAPHLIVHIIPRKENDGINVFDLPEKSMPEDNLKKIQSVLAQRLGMRVSEPEIKKEEFAAGEALPRAAVPSSLKKEIVEEKKEIKYITSAKAKRFHVARCPFADKIPEESRIYLTEEEAKEQRVPCECTGLKKAKTPVQPKSKKLEEVDLKSIEEMLE